MAHTQQYRVVFCGDLAKGYQAEDVKKNLAKMFKFTPQQLAGAFSGKSFVIKDQVDHRTALAYKAAFERAGTVCRIIPVEGKTGEQIQTTPPKEQTAPQQYNVVFEGKIAPGKTPAQVKNVLSALFSTDLSSIFTGNAVTIKTNISRQAALKWQQTFQQAGAICRIEPVTHQIPKGPSAKPQPVPASSPPKAQKKTVAQTPGPGSSKPSAPQAAAPPDIVALVAKYRATFAPHAGIFLAPRIPEERLEIAVRTYAYAFRKSRETAVVLVDLTPSGGCMFLSDKRLYVREHRTAPKTFRLTALQSAAIHDHALWLNDRKIFSIPTEFEPDMPALLEIIQQVKEHAARHAPQPEPDTARPQLSNASERRNPLKTLLVIAGVIVVAGGIIWNLRSSKSPSDTPPPANVSESAEQAPPAAESQGQETTGEGLVNGVKDEGEHCATHKYILPAGSSQLLAFSRRYPVKAPEIQVYEPDNDASMALFQQGIHVSPPVARYSSSMVEYQAWALDGRELFAKIRSASETPLSGSDIVARFGITVNVQTGIFITWREDGYAIIQQPDKFNAKQFGQLSEEELIAALNPKQGRPVSPYFWNNTLIELPAVQIPHQETIKIQTYEVTVTVPTTLDPNSFTSGSAVFHPLDAGEEEGELTVDVSYVRGNPQPDQGHFIVKGPAVTAECFE